MDATIGAEYEVPVPAVYPERDIVQCIIPVPGADISFFGPKLELEYLQFLLSILVYLTVLITLTHASKSDGYQVDELLRFPADATKTTSFSSVAQLILSSNAASSIFLPVPSVLPGA